MTDIPAGSLHIDKAQSAPASKVRGYWGSVWNRLRYDYVTLFCIALIAVIVLLAVFAPWIAPMDPDKSSMANRLRPIGYKNSCSVPTSRVATCSPACSGAAATRC